MAFLSDDPSHFWCEGGVPFEVADDIFLDDDARETVRSAIDRWNSLASLRLFARFDEDNQLDYLVFTKHPNSCSSRIGQQGGAQLVGCPIGGAGGFSAGNVMHEIGHAVGFRHEHCRPDRSQFISINWSTVRSDKTQNFCPEPPRGQPIGSYDYGSIMHYGRDTFTTNGETITPTDASAEIGQRRTLSDSDILAINAMCKAVPYVQELPPSIAAQNLRNVGLVPSFSGDPDGTYVWRQAPRVGTIVGRGSIVTLQLRSGTIPLAGPPSYDILRLDSQH